MPASDPENAAATSEAQPLSEVMALSFLLNAEAIDAELGRHPSSDADAEVVRSELARLSTDDMRIALAGVASITAVASHALAALYQRSSDRAEVRGMPVTDPSAISSLVDYLLRNPFLIPVVAVSLRLLGENRIKIGRLDIRTGSILKELAQALSIRR